MAQPARLPIPGTVPTNMPGILTVSGWQRVVAAPGGGYPSDAGAPKAIRASLGGSRRGRP